MSSEELKGTLDRRQVLQLVGAGGLLGGVGKIPGWSAGENIAGPIAATSEEAPPSTAVPWYGQELVRGHLSWLHPAWTRPEKDFDARRWIDQFERAGFRSFVFYSRFHDGVCNWPSKFQELKPERDFVAEITAEAHRRQLRVILYYSTGPDEWAADRHPDWRCVRRDGSVGGPLAPGYKRWFKFPFCCPNSPYKDYMRGQIEELLTHYDVDGFWLDVMQFPGIDPADPSPRQQGCFCKYCREKYSLATGGGSLFDIDQTPAQRKWEADCWREFLVAVGELVHKKAGERSVTYNGCGHPDIPYYWPEMQKSGDYLSIEGFHYAQVEIGSICRLARSAGKPFEVICVASGQTIGWTPKSSDLILLEAAVVTAHGGTYCCAMDPTASGKIFDSQIDQVGAASAYLRKRENWLKGTSPVYDVGVYHPSYLAPLQSVPDAPALSGISIGWSDVLAQRNVPYAFLYPDSEVTSFPLVVLDSSFPLSEGLVEKLTQYVQQGGNVLAELIPSQLDSPAGKRFLSEILGIEILGPTAYEAVYVGNLDSSIGTGMTEMPTLVVGPSYLVKPTTAQSIANYVYPIAPWSLSRMTFAFHNPPSDEPSRDPAITLNRSGKGLAMFVACSLGGTEVRQYQNVVSDPQQGLPQVHEWSLQLGENLIRRLLSEPLLKSGAPAGVEIVINKQPGRHIVHLANNLLSPMLFSDNRAGRFALSNVSVALNEKRIGPVRRVVTIDGNELRTERDGKWVQVTLPQLKVHEVLAWMH
jgi:hypothetical protein